MTLKQNDVIQQGDEERRCLGPKGGYFTPQSGYKTKEERWDSWSKVTFMIGHHILGADLMHKEFRRV